MSGVKYFGAFIRYAIDSKKLALYVLRLLMLILIVVCSLRYQYRKDTEKYQQELENFAFAQAVSDEHTEATTAPAPYVLESEEIAKVLYGTARNNSAEDQRLVVWCIINRVEHQNYPSTIIDVCKQDSQWMGYSENNPVIETLFNIAREELERYYSGSYRPIPPEYVFLSWNESEIVLRDKFEEKGSVHYWRA